MSKTSKLFLSVEDVAEILETSTSYAYKTIKKLNEELVAKGYLTFPGKISEKYFSEKVYGLEEWKGGGKDAGISRR